MKREFRSYISLTRVNALHGLFAGFLTGMAPMIVIGYGGFEIINGRMTLGSLIAFNSFVGYLFGPASRLINVNISIQKALIALQRVQELFDLPEEEFAKDFQITDPINQIAFKNISFSYQPKELSSDHEKMCGRKNIENLILCEDILSNISLKISKGEKIGIVGGSGSGKTTLLRMLSGLYEPDSGSILLNDKKLSNGEIAAFRKQIAVVEQEPVLFSDTVYNNIRFGNTRARPEEIIAAAKQSHCSEFIDNLAKGYQTEVGNKGGNLSVGQKQRIAIARALIKNPKILILDEATSNIDAISEKYIMDTIYNLPNDMIVIIVAHRLSTIRSCDKIVILEKGAIVESGSHALLVEKAGRYHEMLNINNRNILPQ